MRHKKNIYAKEIGFPGWGNVTVGEIPNLCMS
jgi:hypothetical protein